MLLQKLGMLEARCCSGCVEEELMARVTRAVSFGLGKVRVGLELGKWFWKYLNMFLLCCFVAI